MLKITYGTSCMGMKEYISGKALILCVCDTAKGIDW